MDIASAPSASIARVTAKALSATSESNARVSASTAMTGSELPMKHTLKYTEDTGALFFRRDLIHDLQTAAIAERAADPLNAVPRSSNGIDPCACATISKASDGTNNARARRMQVALASRRVRAGREREVETVKREDCERGDCRRNEECADRARHRERSAAPSASGASMVHRLGRSRNEHGRDRNQPYIYEKGQLQRPRRVFGDETRNQRPQRQAGKVAGDRHHRGARPVLCIQLCDPRGASAGASSTIRRRPALSDTPPKRNSETRLPMTYAA